MEQRKRVRLGTMRLQVRSLASLSGLRIQPALPRDGVEVADVAWILCCYGCGRPETVAPNGPLDWGPPYPQVNPYREEKKRKVKKRKKGRKKRKEKKRKKKERNAVKQSTFKK